MFAVLVQETDIMELEKRYWTLKSGTKTGKFDVDTFSPLVSPPIPRCLCQGVYLKKYIYIYIMLLNVMQLYRERISHGGYGYYVRVA